MASQAHIEDEILARRLQSEGKQQLALLYTVSTPC